MWYRIQALAPRLEGNSNTHHIWCSDGFLVSAVVHETPAMAEIY